MENPLTDNGKAAVVEGVENSETLVRGFAVLTQTCDLVRRCVDRPFAEVSPLVEVNDRVLREIKRGRRPNYGFIPGVADRRLVADLDRVMAVEKGVVTVWKRIKGCRTDEDVRRFSLALARKRARMALPEDFVAFARPLMQRLLEKHDRQSDEGTPRRRRALVWSGVGRARMSAVMASGTAGRTRLRVSVACTSTVIT